MQKLLLLILILTTNLFSQNKEIYIKGKKEGNKIIAYAYNNSNSNVTLEYNAQTKNLVPLCILPIRKTYIPKSKTKVCEFYIKRPNFNYKGNFNKIRKHDNSYIYRLPYKTNTKEQVTQSFDDIPTHKNKSMYAIDFGLKIGTKIFAIRSGIVKEVKEKSKMGGASKKYLDYANSILIEHIDGSYARYSHLMFDGIVVNVGDYIKKGQFIAYSGNTGYTYGPHLHLAVFTKNHTLPIKFKAKRGIIDYPIKGQYYIAID